MTEIAVTGFSRSGKTAFLTSLYWNILHEMNEVKMGARSFDVLNDYNGIRKLSVKDKSLLSFFQNRVELKPFNIDGKKSAYCCGRFPEKTYESESFAFDLLADRSGWNPKKWVNWGLPKSMDFDPRYLFVDFPGERIADVNIAKNESFEGWSKSILKKLEGEEYSTYRDLSAKYRELLDNTSTPVEVLINAYKYLLVDLVRVGFPLISPSAFMLSENGEKIKASTIDSALCGLTKDSQFVPLSDKWKGTQIYKKMQEHYKNYRKKLVLPLFNVIDTADVLVVLFDIADVLTSGYDAYKANVEFLDNLVSLCKASAINPLKFWSVKKIAFVATQCDRVARDDVENLLSLLKELTASAREKLTGEYGFSQKKIECFYCTACQSTIEGDSANTLKGRTKKGTAIHYEVPRIPESFPKGVWQAMDAIPYVAPSPIKGDKPPTQVNLDRILKFMLG